MSLLASGSKLFYETHVRPLLHLNGRVNEIAMDLVCAGGRSLPVLVRAVVGHEEDGSVGLTRVAVFDATERRRYEQELFAEKQRAEEAARRLTVVARTLQDTLMPPRDPYIEGLAVASAYRPAGSGDEIGGDFYDIFAVTERDWNLIIGDVAGKGVEAAVVATLARHTVRALAISEPSPAHILGQLNQVLLSNPSDRFCTANLLRLHRDNDTWNVVMAVGGHPPAVLVNEGRSPRLVGPPGHLVGAIKNASYDDVAFHLVPGDTLVLYTDGVTEARRGEELYGERRLVAQVSAHADSVDDLVEHLLRDVLDFQNGFARDDIAITAVQVPGTSS